MDDLKESQHSVCKAETTSQALALKKKSKVEFEHACVKIRNYEEEVIPGRGHLW